MMCRWLMNGNVEWYLNWKINMFKVFLICGDEEERTLFFLYLLIYIEIHGMTFLDISKILNLNLDEI